MSAKRIRVDRLGEKMTLIYLGVEYPVTSVSRAGETFSIGTIYEGQQTTIDLDAKDYVWIVDKPRKERSYTEAVCAFCIPAEGEEPVRNAHVFTEHGRITPACREHAAQYVIPAFIGRD